MALGPRLDLRQSQQLVMTPQLQQAIRLLALSNIEIEAFIADELERNPLLEIGDTRREDDATPDPGDDRERPERNSNEPAGSDELIRNGGSADDPPLDVDHQNEVFHHDCPSDSTSANQDVSRDSTLTDHSLGMQDIPIRGQMDSQGMSWEEMLEAGETLREHLHGQVGACLSGEALFIGRYLVDMIDDNGYLQGDLEMVARQLGVEFEQVESVLRVIQTFDPGGVGARNLAECIAIQAREADRYDPAMEKLIANLDLLARGKLAQLKRICRVDDEDLADMIAELRCYDPKPGAKYGNSTIDAVVPDIFVVERDQGWSIEINSATLPRLLVNRQYYVEMCDGAHDDQSKSWLNECLNEANWLVKALDQRQRTIIKVASQIVKQQEGFFRHGISHLRPLTLKMVAEEIEMHESTVSRVTSHKYLSCSRGLYELKFFFTSAIQAMDGGDAVSAEAVKNAIRSLIDNETAKKILSDDKLVELLKEQGFDIARRTVAKYRESMGIGSSVQRRRDKKLSGAMNL